LLGYGGVGDREGRKAGPFSIELVPNKRWSDRWDERPTSDRLYARGEDVAAEEDRRGEMKRLRGRRDLTFIPAFPKNLRSAIFSWYIVATDSALILSIPTAELYRLEADCVIGT